MSNLFFTTLGTIISDLIVSSRFMFCNSKGGTFINFNLNLFLNKLNIFYFAFDTLFLDSFYFSICSIYAILIFSSILTAFLNYCLCSLAIEMTVLESEKTFFLINLSNICSFSVAINSYFSRLSLSEFYGFGFGGFCPCLNFSFNLYRSSSLS